MNAYLKKAPTLIVIGVTGFVAYTVLFPDGDPAPPKAESRPPSPVKTGPSFASNTLRNPFQIVKPDGSVVTGEDPAWDETEELATEAKPVDQPWAEDQILESMKLVGTFVDRREQLAVINNKVYARGDQLRGPDGSMLPYIITEVKNDRALVRRGRIDFVIAFSNVPGTAAPRAPNAPKPAEDRALASSPTGATFTPIPKSTKTSKAGVETQPGNDPASQRELLQQLLSSQGGANSAALNSLLTPNAISAGLDAIAGKNDNIGQEGGSAP